ncbi:MAG: hypothetical protein F6K50_06310 [Moorea sp. SIO3I7]|nr:hypothetical protein [Moorena sp. SIO3I7]
MGRKAKAKRNRREKAVRRAEEKLKDDPVIGRVKEFVQTPEMKSTYEKINPSWYAAPALIVPDYLEVNQMIHFWQFKEGKAMSSALSNELIFFEMTVGFNETKLIKLIEEDMGLGDCFVSCNPMTESILYYRGSEWSKEIELYFGRAGVIYRSRSKGFQY